MAGLDQSIKFNFLIKSTVEEILSEDFSILEHIHKGFRYSLELELITNIKTALIKQIREDKSTKEYGDILAYMAPLFLLRLNAKTKVTFKDIDAMKGNPAGEAMMTTFSQLFSKVIGDGKGIDEFLKPVDMEQPHLK